MACRARSKLTEEKLKLLDSAQIDPDNRLTPKQRKQVRELLAKRINAFAVDPKSPTAHI
jgi:Spy/CpxP family protein refolding chaperone